MAALIVSRNNNKALVAKRDAWDMIDSATLTLTREELRAIYVLCGDIYDVSSGQAGKATTRIRNAINDLDVRGEDGSTLRECPFLTTRGPDGDYGIIFYEKSVIEEIEEKKRNDCKAR